MPRAVAATSDARGRAQRARPRLVPGAARRFPVVESKLRVPTLATEAVSRPGLVNRLRAERAPLVTLIAPAGYGKTTLFGLWARRDERPAAWLSLDEHDNDPRTLLRHLAAAFEDITPLEPATARALAGDEPVWPLALPRFLNALARTDRPFVFVLDNAHALERGESADLVLELVKNVPQGSVLALASRFEPPLPLGRLRLTGKLLELRTDDVALSRREAQLVASRDGEVPDDDATAQLMARTEGWAAGIKLAALSDPGADRLLEYVRAEHLDGLPRARRTFLRRSSILESLCAPLCDATLGEPGAARHLEAIRKENLFVVPLETGWIRYHSMFREALRAELEREEPELVPLLHARAAEWFEAHGDESSALDHALAAGDDARAARLFVATAIPAWSEGRLERLDSWLRAIDERGAVAHRPTVAVLVAWVHALQGCADEAKRSLATAEARSGRRRFPDGTAVRSVVELVRAALCAHGVARMRADVRAALAELPPGSTWHPLAVLLDGTASLLAGDQGLAAARFGAAAEAARRDGALVVRAVALAQRSLLAEAAGDHDEGERCAVGATETLDACSAGAHAVGAIVHAAAGRVLLRAGRWDEARRKLALGEEAAAGLTHALPWLAVETRLALARSFVTLRDRAAATTQVEAAEAIFARRAHLGAHAAELGEVRNSIGELPTAQDGHVTGLTAAELRLFPLLATHLSFREIGERLFVSRNTIKTQAISAYRKLGVSSRSAAIARAAELGLIDAGAAEQQTVTPRG